MWRSPVPSRGAAGVFQATPGVSPAARTRRSTCRGWTLLELMIAVFVIGVILKISLPRMQTTVLNYRLGSAASSVAGAIQQTRYQAINVGCSYTIAFTAGSTTYQVQTLAISGTPPACAASFSNVGSAISWTSSGGISLASSLTMQFDANGMVRTGSPLANCSPCSLQLSNGNATRTITVSGVGNVKVASP